MIINNKNYGLFYLKTGILLFWCFWFGIAFLSNLMDLLHFNYGLMIGFKFHSGNYRLVENVISIYGTPSYILSILFYLDVIVQGIITLLFLIAAITFYKLTPYYWKFVNLAFIISIGLWGAFLILEEIFIAYSYEAVHMRLCIFEIVSLLMFHLLQNENRTECFEVTK